VKLQAWKLWKLRLHEMMLYTWSKTGDAVVKVRFLVDQEIARANKNYLRNNSAAAATAMGMATRVVDRCMDS
jgi:hypothetical protein